MARDFVAELGPRVVAYWELFCRLAPKLPPEKRRALAVRFDQALDDSGLGEAVQRMVASAESLCKEFGLELPDDPPVVRATPARRRKTKKAAAAKRPLPGTLGSTPAETTQAAGGDSTPESPREGLVKPLRSGVSRIPPESPPAAEAAPPGPFWFDFNEKPF